MGDLMRPIPFEQLVRRMFEEYRKDGSIFGIPRAGFFGKKSTATLKIFGESCDTPLGPAAGPHTQLAQNIVCAYLAGGRFFELKTVQQLDRLEVSKPCIDAEDECYNCEWSTEFTLEKAYDEYVKAWLLLHVLEELFDLRATDARSFLFNMSVGYDLAGIRTPRMDAYLRKMLDSSNEPAFRSYLKTLDGLGEDGSFLGGTHLAEKRAALRGLSGRISPHISPSVTLSTMHGCPPAEIEAICRYMLTEKKTHTFVKLNPTLLGYGPVREILDSLGFDYVTLSEGSFQKDLQYEDAVSMLTRLRGEAGHVGREFGVKLTNTLGSVNDKGWLPDREMYLSGRALFPLSINLAAKLARELGGEFPISYSGGAAQWNVGRILATGIRPVTLTTDVLKPGGYLRMAEVARLAEGDPSGWTRKGIDVAALSLLAEEARGKMKHARKGWRGADRVSIDAKLPLFDCYAAPCTRACPIGQDVPQYVRLVGEGRYDEALEVIYAKNALPNITGHICDHPCMHHCTRLDYEDPVQIREAKRIAADKGWDVYLARWRKSAPKSEAKVAIIGAGPAGLSAAFFLSRAGFQVTVFEKRESAGGVVGHVIPRFRIPAEAIERDVRFIEAHGVQFRFNQPRPPDIGTLKSEGFGYVFIATGAEAGNPLNLTGDTEKVARALDFLRQFHTDPTQLNPGRSVAVVGGGNTAMDSARAALRVKGVGSVTVLYRRTPGEMPADREEYQECCDEGATFKFLTVPEHLGADGTLVCRKMTLGEPDGSGRRSPVPTDDTEVLQVDTVIAAIGEQVDQETLRALGLSLDARGRPAFAPETGETDLQGVFIGGDALTGPSTVVRCIAEARRVAEAICRKEFPRWASYAKGSYRGPAFDLEAQRRDIIDKKARLCEAETVASLGGDEAFGEREAQRCLECDAICNKCVDVCPNRANVAIRVAPSVGMKTPYQIVHLDALCNECGNCDRFCPYAIDGRPYRDKLTLFSLDEDFVNSENSGFFIAGEGSQPEIKVRLGGRLFPLRFENGRVTAVDGDLHEWDETLAGVARVVETICREYRFLLGPVSE